MALFILPVFLCLGCAESNTSNNLPQCEITFPDDNEEFVSGSVITVRVDAEDSDGTIDEVQYYIDDEGVSSSQSFPYYYDWNTEDVDDGTYVITAICIDNEGGKGTDEVTVIIGSGGGSENAPVASFKSDVNEGSSPLTVNFTDESSNNPTAWLWDFGDGNTSQQQNTVNIYNSNGTYTVSLTVTNSFGSDNIIKSNLINVGSVISGGEPCPGTPTVIDADGNVYNTVLIGDQCWMKENLKKGTFIFGSEISEDNSIVEKYCYNDDAANCDDYGALYQWEELMNYNETESSQGICPVGWHVPSDTEWKQLELYLGISADEINNTGLRGTNEGDMLKSTSEWFEEGNGNNSTGYTALASGWRDASGNFNGITEGAFFWTSTKEGEAQAWHHSVGYYSGGIKRLADYKATAISVRCVKD